jgi:uncharacterized protein YndB with AHSA1/START domain
MFKKILIGLVLLVIVAVIVVAVQPAVYRIERSATINAPPAEVFPHVNDFHKWEAWSPWAKLDPAAKNTFEGPAAGKDAIFKWTGNDKVGEGSMTILESQPPELVRIKLAFIKPFEDTCTTEFAFKGDDKTTVNWSMYGTRGFVNKAICLFMDMDKMVGGSFEEGLANLKAVVEAKKDSSNSEKQ